jgi:hypothetical protein
MTIPRLHRLAAMRFAIPLLLLPATLLAARPPVAAAQALVLDSGTHRLRAGSGPEWSDATAHPHVRVLELRFDAREAGAAEHTLALRQTGVRRDWTVELNGAEIGRLYPDENTHAMHYAVPAAAIRAGENRLRIAPTDTLPDDIEVSALVLHQRPRAQHLGAATLEVHVDGEDGAPIPARLTIVDERGALVELGTESGGLLAVRPGVVYTGDGSALLRLPAGLYSLYATRGFEYGVDSVRVEVAAGRRADAALRLRREVPTEGWVAADTHLHTGTHSGHGDATVEERVITIAGEGLELPILTDHGVHVDLAPTVAALGLGGHFTPVVGNELTTPIGHFNLFPVPPDGAPPSPRVRDWEEVSRGIAGLPGIAGVVLNHPRDIHAGFRPFGSGQTAMLPDAGTGTAGEERWPLPANAMEILNSGSQQSDPLQLFGDWLEMLRRGHRLTPVGASDSHDVARYIPGQGRTYIRADDADPGRIDIAAAMERFRAGAVMVSFGLLAELTVDDRYRPGDTVPAGGEALEVAVRVLGPSWTRAERVSLYLDGERVRSETLRDDGAAGVKGSARWRIPRPPAGAHLVALAEGPDPRRPFWPIALPYQPTSPRVAPRVLGVSGAVRVE